MVEILRVLSKVGKREGVGGPRRGGAHREQDVGGLHVGANRRVARRTSLKIERYFAIAAQRVGARAGLEIVQRNSDTSAETPCQVWNRDGVRSAGVGGDRDVSATHDSHSALGGN